MTEILALASGKGGVGKTLLTAALGLTLGERGHRVLLIDGDAGMKNLDIPLGLSPDSPDLWALAEGRCLPSEAVLPVAEHVDFIGAPAGTDWKDMTRGVLLTVLEDMEGRYDYILIDCPAGLGKGLRFARRAADRLLLVASPDPASLRAVRRVGVWAEEKKKTAVVYNDFGRPGGDPVSLKDAVAGLPFSFAGVVPHSGEAASLAAEGRLASWSPGSFRKAVQMVCAQWLGGAEYPFRQWETLLPNRSGEKAGRPLRQRLISASWKWRRR